MTLDRRAAADPRDPHGMLAAVRGLPDQIEATWAQRGSLALPWRRERFDHVAILGMGGSAIGGDLAAGLLADRLNAPVIVVRDDRLPRWVGARTLAIGVSVSGRTTETLATWSDAVARGCAAVAVTRGGVLADRAQAAGAPIIRLPDGGPPRTALGHTFSWCAAILERLGFVDGIEPAFAEATAAMRALIAADAAHDGTPGPAPAATPASVVAALDGVVPIVYTAAALEAVGRRWKAQLNENAKMPAAFDCAPELHHNSVVGYAAAGGGAADRVAPVLLWTSTGAAAMTLTARLLDDLGLAHVDVQPPAGLSPLAQGLWLVQFGDLVSVRAAYRRGVDPTPIDAIDRLKALRAATGAG